MTSHPDAWTRFTGLTLLLAPLSWLYRAVIAVRRVLYATGLLPRTTLTVPVIVVGNISVGGTGKTPLVIWLAERLRQAGFTPGVISRGYGGTAHRVQAVRADDDPRICGDEPVIIARRTACPVWIGKRRGAAARALLAANPACTVLISDDGLQHYALARDVEIAVIDGARGLGNGWLLPAGPLREAPSRLHAVDAVVVRGPATATRYGDAQFAMALEATLARNVRDPKRAVTPEHFRGLHVHAVAGIGNPQQFFDTLTRLGIAHTPHAFADHHAFEAAELAFDGCDAILMTEKDAVKCERFANDAYWVLQADARVDEALLQRVLQRIHRKT